MSEWGREASRELIAQVVSEQLEKLGRPPRRQAKEKSEGGEEG